MKTSAALSCLALSYLALAAPALAAPPPIAPGKYHCIAGSSRMMLTLGDMVVTGTRYRFTDPTGHVTAGSYAPTATGYRWLGDVGGLRQAQIVDSGPDATRGDFWLRYKARPTSLPTSLACQRV